MLNRSPDPEPVLQAVMAEVTRLMRAERGLLLVEDAGGEMQVAAGAGDQDGRRVSRRVLDLVRQQRKPLLMADALEDPDLAARESIRAHLTHSVLCAPLLTRGRMLGVLYLDSSLRVGLFSRPDLQVGRILADMIASALDRSRTFRAAVENERLATLGTTVAGILHELNNPLTVIESGADLALMQESVPENVRELLAGIQGESGRCVEMLKQLLDMTRGAADQPRLEPVDVPALLDRVVRLMRPRLLQQGVELELRVPPEGPSVQADPGKLIQVLMNLVANAGRALKGPGRIEVSAATRDGAVVLEVADEGPGVPPEVRGRLFEPFVSTGGTGLGLYVSQALARAHGGFVDYRDRAGGGAVFTVHLPAGP